MLPNQSKTFNLLQPEVPQVPLFWQPLTPLVLFFLWLPHPPEPHELHPILSEAGKFETAITEFTDPPW
jgi:hypothetical protein